MEIFTEIEPLRAFLNGKRIQQASIGLVPTMGALHKGHLSLIRASKAENSLTVCSIYINPTQFNNSADLEKYPRNVEVDTELLKTEGCDVLFIPPNSEMYAVKDHIKFDFGRLDKVLEGEFRPGHFSGVALVVSKLFNIVQADRAYFGQKDFQQLQIISRLVEELKFPVKLKSVPIERESDGLAMSSRNQRLSVSDRKKAVILFDSLRNSKAKLKSGTAFPEIKQEVIRSFNETVGVKLEYFELADKKNLTLLNNVTSFDQVILLIAAFVGGVRLIDNMLLED